MLGTAKCSLPLPMRWQRCVSTTGPTPVFASLVIKIKWKNYPVLCASALCMHFVVRPDGQSRAKDRRFNRLYTERDEDAPKTHDLYRYTDGQLYRKGDCRAPGGRGPRYEWSGHI